VIPLKPRYVIEKVTLEGKRRWRIMVFRCGRTIGEIIDHKSSKKAAIVVARLLAGMGGNIEVFACLHHAINNQQKHRENNDMKTYAMNYSYPLKLASTEIDLPLSVLFEITPESQGGNIANLRVEWSEEAKAAISKETLDGIASEIVSSYQDDQDDLWDEITDQDAHEKGAN